MHDQADIAADRSREIPHVTDSPLRRPGPRSIISGGGEMGALVRAFDWAATPLGPPERWPVGLRTTVNLVLNARHPMLLFWGPELIQFYNDAFRQSLGADKHPRALGQPARECWSDAWPIVGHQVEAVLERGESTWNENYLVPIDRNGRREEVYWTYGYSPAWDATGMAAGVLVVVTETTGTVVANRRLRTLAELATAAGRAQSAAEAGAAAARVLATNANDLPFALVYLLESDGTRAHLVGRAGLDTDAGAAPEWVEVNGSDEETAAAWPIARVARTGAMVRVRDVVARFGPLSGYPWPEPVQEALVLPISAPDQARPTGILVAGLSPRLPVTEDYEHFASLIADQIAATVANAHAREAADVRQRLSAELAAELSAMEQLQDISTQLIQEDERDALYQKILDAAIALMRSDMASMQMLMPDGRELRLLAWAGFHPVSAAHWSSLTAEADTSCGAALRTGQRIVVPDVETCEFITRAPAELDEYRRSGIRAMQSTPLISRTGRLLGMLSTHWREPHQPTQRDFRLLDVLARLAADSIERAAVAMDNARLYQAERRARTEAEEANRAKSEFLATMSHELRTPLNAIGGYVQLIALGVHGPVTEKQRVALERVQKNQQHLLALINDILNFAKLEAGRVEYHIETVALADAVADVVSMVEPELAAKRLTATVTLARDLVVRADREKLQQIVLNLLTNAIKFTEPGGRVTIATEARDSAPPGVVFLRVTDTGCGIPRDKQDVVFDPFVQVHRRLTHSTEGTGLGLAISRDLARAMGGDLRVRSIEFEGSTFTLTLRDGRTREGIDEGATRPG